MKTLSRHGSLLGKGLLFSVAMLVAGGCSSPRGGGGGGKEGFQPPPTTAKFIYERVDANGAKSPVPMQFVGEKEMMGVVFSRAQVGDFGAYDPEGAEAWLTFDDGDIVVGGFEWWQPGLGDGTMPDLSVTAEEPVRIPMEVPVGEPQHRDATGLVSLEGAEPQPMTVAVDWTLVETEGSVLTPLGPQHGLLHSTVSASVLGNSIAAEVWGRSGVGLVAGYVESDLIPGRRSLGLLSYLANEAAENGYWLMRGDGVLSPASPWFGLDTYDVANLWDADKNTHAKMILELRWVDETRALTEEPPPAVVSAGTAIGSFLTTTEASPVSLQHPEENGLGYVHWVTVVDEAAKNEPDNGISYHIEANYAGGEGDVRVSASLLYKRLDTEGGSTVAKAADW